MVDYRIMQYIRSIKQNLENIKKIDKETLIEHPQICFELIKSFPDGVKYIPMDVREEIPQVCVDAVKANPENINIQQTHHRKHCLQQLSHNLSNLFFYQNPQIISASVQGHFYLKQ